VHIQVKKGLDIPLSGAPLGAPKPIKPAGEAKEPLPLEKVALDVRSHEDVRFKLLKKVGDTVKRGEPLLEDKRCPGRMFVSPGCGIVEEIRRGEKRRLLDVVIKLEKEEEDFSFPPLEPASATKEEMIKRLLEGGAFSRLYRRPFNVLAHPEKLPSATFVKAMETAPFSVPAEMQVQGYEEIFQIGLDALAKLTEGPVHLVYKKGSLCTAFTKAKNVQLHTADGPHPAATHSLHIQKIRPIFSASEVVWTANVLDVLVIGRLLKEGRLHTERIVGIGGPPLVEGQTGYFYTREGAPISYLTNGRLPKIPLRLISGDPLMGTKVEIEDYLGMQDTVLSVIAEPTSRELLHFFRLGLNKYSFSRAYYTPKRNYSFTTSQHGEKRAFIDPTLYDEVQALDIPTMQLVKAVMAEDIELAEELGIYEVASEDFALPTFVCPSKIDMTEIVKQGLRTFAAEMLH
jgi:Na+-transporting NADH:ubiquinone oxidoreductase subunit A